MAQGGAGQTVLDVLSATSLALLRKARRGADDDAEALVRLRDEISGLSDEELEALWDALGAEPAPSASKSNEGPGETYRAVDKARRKLGVNAARFKDMLIAHFESAGDPAPQADGASLRAFVDAFADADRGGELVAAAQEIVRARSMAFDIT